MARDSLLKACISPRFHPQDKVYALEKLKLLFATDALFHL